MRNTKVAHVFQSYQGSIFTDVVLDPFAGSNVFQSYQGSIFTCYFFERLFGVPTFNPIKVRFLQGTACQLFVWFLSFQSYPGSIFTDVVLDPFAGSNVFQSYQGSIFTGFDTTGNISWWSFNPIKVRFLRKVHDAR